MTGTPSPPATTLVVEDDPHLLSVLRRILEHEHYRVLTAQDGQSALSIALDEQPELVILDIGLPVRSGIDVARELRNRGFRAPILMLTARGTVSDKVTGLDAGADDYLAKPFENPELVARARALLRRASIASGSAVIRVADLTLDPVSREVRRDGQEIELTQKEYAVLEYLARRAGRVVSRQAILHEVWKQPPEAITNVVDVYINYLRKKLGGPGRPQLIHTVRGEGYVVE